MAPLIIVSSAVGFALLYLFLVFNGIVSLRRQVENAFVQIEVHLRQRHELVPQIADILAKEMTSEQGPINELRTSLDQARKGPGQSAKASAESRIGSLLSILLAKAETYPDLRASGELLGLREQLRKTDSKIAFSTNYHNDIVTVYNEKVETFPYTIFANYGKFTPKVPFVISASTGSESARVSLVS
jgi:LemA protein